MSGISRYFVLASTISSAVACSGNAAGPSSEPPASSPSIVAIQVTPFEASVALFTTISLRAVGVRSDGSRSDVPARWTTSDRSIAIVRDDGLVTGLSVGTAVIEAEVDGLKGDAVIAVAPAGPNVAPLSVDVFSVVRFRSASPSAGWLYAPLVLVSASNAKAVDVFAVDVTIPGLPTPMFRMQCGAHLTSGSTRQLNGVANGDWNVVIAGPELVDPAAMATATVWYVGEVGVYGTFTLTGPVVTSAPPTTYAAGLGPGACVGS